MEMGGTFKTLGLGLAVGALGAALFALPPVFEFEEYAGLYFLFHARGPRPPPPEVVIVALDRESAGRLGLPEQPDRWPRRLHSRLTHALSAAGARVIAFDLLFDTPHPPDEDNDFAAAIVSAANVVLVEDLRGEIRGNVYLERSTPPIPAIAAAARVTAPFVLPNEKVRVNGFWPFRNWGGNRPSL